MQDNYQEATETDLLVDAMDDMEIDNMQNGDDDEIDEDDDDALEKAQNAIRDALSAFYYTPRPSTMAIQSGRWLRSFQVLARVPFRP